MRAEQRKWEGMERLEEGVGRRDESDLKGKRWGRGEKLGGVTLLIS